MKRNRINYIGEINIVPLLDILIILVLIFIMTSSFLISILKVELPNVKTTNIEQNNINSIIIFEILDINRYNVIINGHRKQKIDLNDIMLLVRSEILKSSKTIFLIAGNKNVPYKEIISILNILYQLGVKSIGFVTQPI